MIVSLTGRLVEVQPTSIVLDVGGVGYAVGVSAATVSSLPVPGSDHVTVFTRMVVRDNGIDLYGFATTTERAVFDRLVQIGGVGPKLAISVLSTFTPQALMGVVADQDVTRMSKVPGVGKKTATRLIMELADVFKKDPVLATLVPETASETQAVPTKEASGVEAEAFEALLAMGFTQQEARLALEGHEREGAASIEKVLSYALRRMGGR